MDLATVVRTTVLLAAALLVARLCGRARASARHVVLAAALGALLVVPALSAVPGVFQVTVPVMPLSTAGVASLQAGVPLSAPAHGSTPSGHDARFSAARGRPAGAGVSVGDALFVVWSIGVAVFFAPMFIGIVQLSTLRRSAVCCAVAQRALDGLSARRGITRRVQVLSSERVTGPLTCGITRPAVLLPADAVEWDRDTLRRALVHELEHVRRWDMLTNVIARAACAVYWFHPLAWIAWRQLVLEAERACDDAVVEQDDAPAYASLLVSVAERGRRGARPPLLAMATRGHLARRVAAILDRQQARGRVGRTAVMCAVVVAGVLIGAVSSIRVIGAQAAPAGAGENLTITVLDPSGQPVADVPVLVESGPFEGSSFAQGYTDANGHCRLQVAAGRYTVTAPVDFFPATQVAVAPGERVERVVRMEIQPAVGTVTVCVDCRDDSSYVLPQSILDEFRDDRDALLSQLVKGAEPQGGWEVYQPPLPGSLRQIDDPKVAGRVVVEGRIGTDGIARELHVESAAHPALALAAVAALDQTLWTPARVRGRAVEVPLRVTFDFTRERK
jgi:beta-lactamase regulating signal transducer with metallopeptidase domain